MAKPHQSAPGNAAACVRWAARVSLLGGLTAAVVGTGLIGVASYCVSMRKSLRVGHCFVVLGFRDDPEKAHDLSGMRGTRLPPGSRGSSQLLIICADGRLAGIYSCSAREQLPKDDRSAGFGGLSYNRVQRVHGQLTIQMVSVLVPLWMPFATFGVYPMFVALAFVRHRYRHRQRRRRGQCVKCGYDLQGNTTGVCPECGESFERVGRPTRQVSDESMKSPRGSLQGVGSRRETLAP